MTDRDGFVEQSLELIGRLEAAPVGSRELDAAICVALQYGGLNSEGAENVRTDPEWEGDLIYEIGAEECYCPIPPVTTSLDAALALAERVLPDLQAWRVERDGHKHWGRVVYAAGLEARTADAATGPLALCIAVLKARATPEGMRKQPGGAS